MSARIRIDSRAKPARASSMVIPHVGPVPSAASIACATFLADSSAFMVSSVMLNLFQHPFYS